MNDREFGPGGGKFDPTRYLRQLRGRGGSSDYLDVKWRLVWLRSEHPDAQISTEHVSIGADSAVFKATVAIPGGGSATGYGSETKGDFGDFIEKAETKALGRALLALGYGTQFAQDFGDEELPVAESAPRQRDSAPVRPVAPAGGAPAPARPSAPERISPAPAEPPAEARRPTPVRPLREAGAAGEAPAAPPVRAESAPRAPQPAPRPAEDDDDFGRVVGGGPSRATDAPVAASRPAARLSPPQPAPRPAPRPAPAATPTDERDGDDEIDMANYGWTEFWSWARSRGFNDRKALDAAVGRSTTGMTPLEIRKQIQAKQD